MSATTQERRNQIVAQVLKQGRISVRELAQRLNVSEATVRRDLRSLADEGQVDLYHGGATLPRNSDYSFMSKATRHAEAKQQIGRLAAQLVSDNDQLFIDSGTTCFEMTPHLKPLRGLSVIVNSTRIAMELAGEPDLSLILIGGQYRAERMDTVGPMTIHALEQLRGYVAFIGADGLSTEFGVTASDMESAHVYRLAVRNARETVLLADHSKFVSPSLFKIVEWDAISRVVTDTEPADDWKCFFESQGIDLVFPGRAPQPISFAEEELARS